MKRIFLISLIFCHFFGLPGQGLTEIDIPGLLKTERDPVLSEIASDVRFVKLQTTPDCLIGSVGSVTRWGNDYLITANRNKPLLVFSRDGRFLRSVGTIGKGPGEFLEIYGMAFDSKTDHFFVLDNGQVKVLEYDETGKFVREFKPGFYATGLKVLENGFVFYTGSVYTYKTDGFLLTVTDRNGKVLNRFHKKTMMRGLPDRVATRYTDQGNFCYWEPYWDTVYSFNGSAVHPKYFFNIGKTRIPQEFLESSDLFSHNVDGYTWIDGYREFQKFLWFRFIDKNRRGKSLFYDKISKTGYCMPGNTDYNDWGFMNDFCGGLLFSPDIKMSMTEAACAYQMVDLKEYLAKGRIDPKKAKNPARCKELTDLINRSSVDDNPILIMADLK